MLLATEACCCCADEAEEICCAEIAVGTNSSSAHQKAARKTNRDLLITVPSSKEKLMQNSLHRRMQTFLLDRPTMGAFSGPKLRLETCYVLSVHEVARMMQKIL